MTSTSKRPERERLAELLARIDPRRIVVATGAGLSVASGLPTYRGEDGYWTETSANYRPQETGYLSTFLERPREVWWYALAMRERCLAAEPNAAHFALARLEQTFGDDFLLVTQNVDGLHLRAGNSPARTIEAHGSHHHMRAVDGEATLLPIPAQVRCPEHGRLIDEASFAALRTPDGRPTRPHAMYFDEPYDEALYRTDTALAAAKACDLLIVIGTSGATGIPWHLAVHALEADAAIITIDPQDTPFGTHARNRERAGKGLWLQGTSDEWVPELVERLVHARRRREASPSQVTRVAVSSRSGRRDEAPLPPVVLAPRVGPKDPDFEASRKLAELLGRWRPRRVVVSTGAGISAESGIPTYRGPEGYWVVGSRANSPLRRADLYADPRAAWGFCLGSRGVCNAAEPNAAHLALAALERELGDDLRVITQNVDGLHLRAGNSPARTYELHGNINWMRAFEGDPHPVPVPKAIPATHDHAQPVSDAVFDALVMPDGSPARPHTLMWDEAYNEVQYRSESALAAGRDCDLLVVVGTSGSAAMPYALAAAAVLEGDALLIDINVEDNAYAEHAEARAEQSKGLALRGPATRWVPELVEQLLALRRLG